MEEYLLLSEIDTVGCSLAKPRAPYHSSRRVAHVNRPYSGYSAAYRVPEYLSSVENRQG